MRLRLSVLCLLAALSPGLVRRSDAAARAVAVDTLVPSIAPAPIGAAGAGAPGPAGPDARPAARSSAGTRAAHRRRRAGARTTLVPTPGDPTNVEEVVLAGKPAAIVTGTSNWDEAFNNLKGAFAKIEDELKRAGIAPTGKPADGLRPYRRPGFSLRRR